MGWWCQATLEAMKKRRRTMTDIIFDNQGSIIDADRDHKIRAFARAEWGAEPGGDFEDAMVIEHDAEVDITSTGVWVQAWVYVERESE